MPANLVPATPSVISWAIHESGYSVSALATLLRIPENEITSWTRGVHPESAKLAALAKAVERPFSAFLLPHPPTAPHPSVKFRSTNAANRRPLIVEERRRIREAGRLQGILSWLSRELQLPSPDLPSFTTRDDPELVGAAIRERLNLALDHQFSWSSTSEALNAWREAAEAIGITVLMLPMGEESCRGFSIWDDAAPLVAVNTAWLPEARLFTLVHELAHLSSGTNSACSEDPIARPGAGDRTERWCDRVAAAVLMPADGFATVLREVSKEAGSDLRMVGRLAARFRVSRRAAALRLIEHRRAPWSLFRSIPPHQERRPSSRGGTGRTRAEIRRQQYGQRTMELFRSALRHDVLGAAEIVDYLGVSPEALAQSPTGPLSRGEG